MNPGARNAWLEAKRKAVLSKHPAQVRCLLRINFMIRGGDEKKAFRMALLIPSLDKLREWWKVVEAATREWVDGRLVFRGTKLHLPCRKCGES